MIKAIMAIDDKGGISKGPKYAPGLKIQLTLKWFKENTIK